ncbi:SDR family NAD(P)-dependent oxidoreductase [Azospirillum picis]|uniref:NAD(P)-dependent dehydrogenase (Short-subunit alcohol dehydrogenase family) n=1 Tax=Azospirillum picis TaxID=488438 RepID=A0ABU0MM56_9PROT|nr:glucose 1-dehydrogenase [Azospirillum picis]MBP2300576.1 NAD(P)-dependent dehydrogenase (short-subunit alcohol dehydrogenase family) [Azospirillum picis]MDQ0534545.1 NAD(P)-dependent dehydrogenase (short-subunit alcohol dehydrogenase family) [Azospirillum picis]
MKQALENRIALVTGAARGIGRATAMTLRARGALVVATDISETVHELSSDGIVTLTGDIALEETARRSVALALERFGGLDILVNNAGRTMNRPLIDMTIEDWDSVMSVNARGTFLHAREAVRAMIAGNGGAIVNVASIVAQVAMKDTAAYAASKGAIAQLTKVIAVEYGDRNVRANAVAPGVVETDILEDIVPDSRATLASYGPAHPLGRVGQPQEIAEVIAFLASPASAFMTGSLVTVDGGFTAL